jgi:diguanylate cyclase (GGDEF)-like protein
MDDSRDRAAKTVSLLRSVLRDPEPPSGTPPELLEVEGLDDLVRELSSLRRFALAIAEGDLGASLEMRGRTAGALKALQANLRHLTWQVQAVAAGDLGQRVLFLGEFSAAFNTMVKRLTELQDGLRQQAIRDPLTGLLNRRYLDETLPREFALAIRRGTPIALMMVDLDHFKQVNDTLGHATGDQVLRALGGLLRALTRASDVACRWGGEEFVVMMPGAALDAAIRRAEEMRRSFETLSLPGEANPPCSTFSAGLALFPLHASTPQALLEAADEAMYAAKAAGRNRVGVSTRHAP